VGCEWRMEIKLNRQCHLTGVVPRLAPNRERFGRLWINPLSGSVMHNTSYEAYGPTTVWRIAWGTWFFHGSHSFRMWIQLDSVAFQWEGFPCLGEKPIGSPLAWIQSLWRKIVSIWPVRVSALAGPFISENKKAVQFWKPLRKVLFLAETTN